VFTIELSDSDCRQIQALIADLRGHHTSVEDEALLDDLAVYSHEMPRAVRLRANEFRLREPSGGCLFTGFPVDDLRIGDTPAGWNNVPDQPDRHSPTLTEDLYFLLCASLLGDPIAWATQQDGQLLHDVIPIKGHENEQINSSTTAPLWWHTEDAFHPYRADYVGLLCLRNPDAVETTFTEFDDLVLDRDTIEILLQPRYVIRPDESHLVKNRAASSRLRVSADLLQRSYDRVSGMQADPPKVPVLFGDPQRPYGRLDPYFMDRIEDDPRAMEAFDLFVKEIDDKISSVRLKPGDALFIDNYKAVHGRKPYTARFDGRDRWLRRVNLSRDLRKSRDARMAAHSRVIF